VNISIIKRIITVYITLGKTFGSWISPISSGILIGILRLIVGIGMALDNLFWPSLFKRKLTNPMVIVGNPRSGTTFLHRFLVSNKIAGGAELWQLLYPSLTLQKLIKPLLPVLERISPTRHHSTAAHKTSLQSVETDDASVLFRYLDGFFLYGFILSWADDDIFHWFDPHRRDTSKRDFNWLSAIWNRVLISSKQERIIGKLFSLSANTPKFQSRFPDAKILYMVRDPLSVIPSGLSLVTGVLDKRFGFWSLPDEMRARYIKRLYKALVELLKRFHDDWINDRINRDKVMIIPFDRMMNNFEELMTDITNFIEFESDETLLNSIRETADSQRNFKSKHTYDLEKFGLSSEQVKSDCSFVYNTFLNQQ